MDGFSISLAVRIDDLARRVAALEAGSDYSDKPLPEPDVVDKVASVKDLV